MAHWTCYPEHTMGKTKRKRQPISSQIPDEDIDNSIQLEKTVKHYKHYVEDHEERLERVRREATGENLDSPPRKRRY